MLIDSAESVIVYEASAYSRASGHGLRRVRVKSELTYSVGVASEQLKEAA